MYSKEISKDIERIRQIPIVPTILEVICRTAGMGFAAVARVTDASWVACSVRDEISFGLQPGGELKLETTICNEIRSTHEPVVINHVEESETYRDHHTPELYGFQSYISVPIIKRNGELFGTLCAIDPKPSILDDGKTLSMFKLFAELIAFHLETVEKLEKSDTAVHVLEKQLSESRDENRQYRFISNHNLQEPLRKLRVFSNILENASADDDLARVRNFAGKISQNAKHFSMMIKDLSQFSDLTHLDVSTEKVDLNQVLSDVISQVDMTARLKKAEIEVSGSFPLIRAVTTQMEQLFYHLITNAIKFAKPDVIPRIVISSKYGYPMSSAPGVPGDQNARYLEIRIQDNGIGIDAVHLEKIFDIFQQLDPEVGLKSAGIGLSYCRKILRNHGGTIVAESEEGVGTTFILYFPADRIIEPK